MIAHHFTIDVEEYFQVSAFEARVARSDWGRLESRVAREVGVLLELLARHQTRATWFVLGWVAHRQPGLIRAIARAGHEIASHGWDHARVTHQTPVEFRQSFRLFPYGVVRAALLQSQRRGVPGTFYIHPWELDPAQPRFHVPWLTRVRHYGGLRRTGQRLERLLGEFRFTAVQETVTALSAVTVDNCRKRLPIEALA